MAHTVLSRRLMTLAVLAITLFTLFFAAAGAMAAPASLSGDIIIDGSSTVFPITEAVAEEFRMTHPDVNITIGISGTGGGFKKFLIG